MRYTTTYTGTPMNDEILVINEHETCSINVTEPVIETIPPLETRQYPARGGVSAWTQCNPKLRITLTIGKRRAKNAILRLYEEGAFNYAVDWITEPDTGWIWIVMATLAIAVGIWIANLSFAS